MLIITLLGLSIIPSSEAFGLPLLRQRDVIDLSKRPTAIPSWHLHLYPPREGLQDRLPGSRNLTFPTVNSGTGVSPFTTPEPSLLSTIPSSGNASTSVSPDITLSSSTTNPSQSLLTTLATSKVLTVPTNTFTPSSTTTPRGNDAALSQTTTSSQGNDATLSQTTTNGVDGSSSIGGTMNSGHDLITGTALKTFSGWPSSITTSTTSVATNTHDSSGHPIFGPWPDCFFCPIGSMGFILGGIDFPPGVYPGPVPPVPGLSGPWPPVTIGPDGVPKYSSPSPSQSPSASSTSSSSSGSCTLTRTATHITHYVSYGTDSSGSTTATSTLSTASAVTEGCSVVPTTVTQTTTRGSATSTYYIFPVDPTDSAGNAAIVSAIKSLSSEPNIHVLGTELTGVQYYTAVLPEDSIEELGLNKAVDVIGQIPSTCRSATCISLEYDSAIKRAPNNRWQQKNNPPKSRQLSFLSETPGERLPRNPPYMFRESPGEGIYVYIVDSGADLDNPQFSKLKQRLGSIQFAGPDWEMEIRGEIPSTNAFPPGQPGDTAIYHGSEVLSMIAANDIGVADHITPVIVRDQRSGTLKQDYGQFLRQLQFILQDWIEKRRINPALNFGIINLSWEFNLPHGINFNIVDHYFDQPEAQKWSRGMFGKIVHLMGLIADAGLLFVASAGNYEGESESMFACLASPNFQWDPHQNQGHANLDDAILVVGSVRPEDGGVYSRHASGNLVHVYAPGVNLYAAAMGTRNGLTATNNVAGTSHACATTSGIIAYLASNTQEGAALLSATDLRGNVRAMRQLLLDSAWARPANIKGQEGVYNLAPPPKDCKNNKRQANMAGEDLLNSALCAIEPGTDDLDKAPTPPEHPDSNPATSLATSSISTRAPMSMLPTTISSLLTATTKSSSSTVIRTSSSLTTTSIKPLPTPAVAGVYLIYGVNRCSGPKRCSYVYQLHSYSGGIDYPACPQTRDQYFFAQGVEADQSTANPLNRKIDLRPWNATNGWNDCYYAGTYPPDPIHPGDMQCSYSRNGVVLRQIGQCDVPPAAKEGCLPILVACTFNTSLILD